MDDSERNYITLDVLPRSSLASGPRPRPAWQWNTREIRTDNTYDVSTDGQSTNLSAGGQRRRPTPVHGPSETGLLRKIFHFFDIPEDRQKIPVVTWLFPLVWLSLFIYQTQYYDRSFWAENTLSGEPTREMQGMHYPQDVVEDRELWEYLTYSYLHLDFYHLLANMLTFLLFGFYLEKKFCWYRLLIICNLGAIAGGIVFVAQEKWSKANAEPTSSVNLVGASAGVYALIGAYISELFVNPERINTTVRILLALMLLSMHAYEYVVIEDSNIAVYGHLGGLVYGIFPAMLIFPNYTWEPWEAITVVLAVVIHLLIFIGLPLYIYL